MYQKTELVILCLLKSCSQKKWVALHEKLTNITAQSAVNVTECGTLHRRYCSKGT